VSDADRACGLRRAAWFAAVGVTLLFAGCTHTRKLGTAIPSLGPTVIASASDDRITGSLDGLIVRDGPGTWASNANWDEYLLRLDSISAVPVEITGIALVDFLGKGVAARGDRAALVAASEDRSRQYRTAGIRVVPGVGASTLFGSAAVVLGSSAVAGVGALAAGSGAAGSAAMASASTAGALVVAPALLAAGTVVAIEEHQVDREIRSRSTALPLPLAAQQQGARLDAFFPLSPAPRQLLVNYRDASGQHTLTLDTKAALAYLHLPPP
jgi:hypothetical protein